MLFGEKIILNEINSNETAKIIFPCYVHISQGQFLEFRMYFLCLSFVIFEAEHFLFLINVFFFSFSRKKKILILIAIKVFRKKVSFEEKPKWGF